MGPEKSVNGQDLLLKDLSRKLFQDIEPLLHNCKTFGDHIKSKTKVKTRKSKINVQEETIWDPLRKSCAKMRRLHGRDLQNKNLSNAKTTFQNPRLLLIGRKARLRTRSLIVQNKTPEEDFKALTKVGIQNMKVLIEYPNLLSNFYRENPESKRSRLMRPRCPSLEIGGNLQPVASPGH